MDSAVDKDEDTYRAVQCEGFGWVVSAVVPGFTLPTGQTGKLAESGNLQGPSLLLVFRICCVNYCHEVGLLLPYPGSPMDPMVMKRPQLYGVGSNPHPQPQQSSPYPGGSYGPPGPQRYPLGIQGRTPGTMGGMQYPQQQMPPQYGQQGVSGYCQQGQQTYYNQQQPQPPHLPPQAQYLPSPSQQRYQPQQLFDLLCASGQDSGVGRSVPTALHV
ncbi:AT-rich interactive domain-containing protein 1B [Tupaia chinensis]|uniref:AT-rich interactive domain-containing protein 1B n=1 Tax=Tupaia chinensis TaxID=246437 RepID=L9JZQ1_TUPCH|nr:AT-rich interactive domain-containing protein 1B [Tupaia chinensis]